MTRMTNMDIEELIFFNTSTMAASPDEPFRERKVEFVQDFGAGKVTECYLEDMHFMHMDLSLKKETKVSFDSQAPVLELQFNLEGHYEPEGMSAFGNALPTAPGTHNILFYPPLKGSHTYYHGAGEKSAILEIHIPYDQFSSLLLRNFPQAEYFLI